MGRASRRGAFVLALLVTASMVVVGGASGQEEPDRADRTFTHPEDVVVNGSFTIDSGAEEPHLNLIRSGTPNGSMDASWRLGSTNGDLLFYDVANDWRPFFIKHGLDDKRLSMHLGPAGFDVSRGTANVGNFFDSWGARLATPRARGILDVAAAGNIAFIVDKQGRIGVGTSRPRAALEVFRSSGTARVLVREINPTVASRQLLRLENNGPVRFLLHDAASDIQWQLATGRTGAFSISRRGTSGPEFQLFADGSVAIGPGPDRNLLLDAEGNLTVTGDITANGTLLTPQFAAENEALRERVADLEARLAALEAALAQLSDG